MILTYTKTIHAKNGPNSSNFEFSGFEMARVSLEECFSFATKKSMTKCFKQLIIDYNNTIIL